MERILITGMPRSGSKWVTGTLRAATGTTHTAVRHEPNFAADYRVTRYLWDGQLAKAQELIDQRGDPEDCDLYIEVAPCARHIVHLIRKKHPDIKVFHLVRDGRLNVRSMMSRPHYKEGQKPPTAELPAPLDLETRFEKMCWLWRIAARDLRDYPWFQLEELLTKDGLTTACKMMGLSGGSIASILRRHRPEHVVDKTGRYPIPEYEQWTPEMKKQFWTACGRWMELLGYPGHE